MKKRGKPKRPEFCLTCGTDIEEGKGIRDGAVVYCSEKCKKVWEDSNGEWKMIGKILFAIGGFIVGTLFGWQLLEKLAKFLLEKLATLGA